VKEVNDVTTDMQPKSAAVLDEAEAIVEAEWMRFTQDWDQWEQELAEFLAELPAPLSRPPRSCTIAVGHRPTARSPRWRSATFPPRRSAAPTVRATQRSPPAATPEPPIHEIARLTEVMP
jgi:hypothetical protein